MQKDTLYFNNSKSKLTNKEVLIKIYEALEDRKEGNEG